jgi:hypothetical protein
MQSKKHDKDAKQEPLEGLASLKSINLGNIASLKNGNSKSNK